MNDNSIIIISVGYKAKDDTFSANSEVIVSVVSLVRCEWAYCPSPPPSLERVSPHPLLLITLRLLYTACLSNFCSLGSSFSRFY